VEYLVDASVLYLKSSSIVVVLDASQVSVTVRLPAGDHTVFACVSGSVYRLTNWIFLGAIELQCAKVIKYDLMILI